MNTIFDKIVSGEMNSWIVWQDDNYMAFLTPFPNTPGFTVVIPKKNVGDYIFSLDDSEYQGLLKASKIVARKIEKAFNTPRVAMIVEGTGVAHVHVKLIPLHGKLAGETNVSSGQTQFNEQYLGYISTIEGPRMDDERLEEIRKKIAEAEV